MPGKLYSTGSSAVMIFWSGRFSSLSAAYSVVVLPEPVGPVTRKMPLGRRDDLLEDLVVVLLEAQVLNADAHASRAAEYAARPLRRGRPAAC